MHDGNLNSRLFFVPEDNFLPISNDNTGIMGTQRIKS